MGWHHQLPSFLNVWQSSVHFFFNVLKHICLAFIHPNIWLIDAHKDIMCIFRMKPVIPWKVIGAAPPEPVRTSRYFCTKFSRQIYTIQTSYYEYFPEYTGVTQSYALFNLIFFFPAHLRSHSFTISGDGYMKVPGLKKKWGKKSWGKTICSRCQVFHFQPAEGPGSLRISGLWTRVSALWCFPPKFSKVNMPEENCLKLNRLWSNNKD